MNSVCIPFEQCLFENCVLWAVNFVVKEMSWPSIWSKSTRIPKDFDTCFVQPRMFSWWAEIARGISEPNGYTQDSGMCLKSHKGV